MPARPRPRGDDGLGLVETVVAMALFAAFSVFAAGLLVQTFDVTRTNRQRVVAANLAQQQAEVVRGSRAVDLTDGSALVRQVPIDGTTYTVTQTAGVVTAGTSVSLCAGTGDQPAMKQVSVTVTWPGMDSTKPVRVDTLRAFGLGVDGPTGSTGTVVALLRTAAGAPQSGIAVRLEPGGLLATTGADGCAVWLDRPGGTTYTASVDQSPYVGTEGTQAVSGSVALDPNRVARITLTYEPYGGLQVGLVRWSTSPDYPMPLDAQTGMGLSLVNSRYAAGRRSFPVCGGPTTDPSACVTATATTREATRLFPGVYTAYAGRCADATGASASSAAGTVGSGTTAVAASPIRLAGVSFQVRESSSSATTGLRAVYAVHAPDASCPSGVVLSLGQITSDTRNNTAVTHLRSLPAGTWQLVALRNPAAPAPPATATGTGVTLSNAGPAAAGTVWAPAA